MNRVYTQEELQRFTIKSKTINLHSICQQLTVPYSKSDKKDVLIQKILKAQQNLFQTSSESKSKSNNELIYLQKHCKEMENMIDILLMQFSTLQIKIPYFLEQKIVKQIISDEETCYVCMELLTEHNIKFNETCGHYCCSECFKKIVKCGLCR